MPRLFIFAGPNGSGKSSIFSFLSSKYKDINALPFINSDEIAKEINGYYLQDTSAKSNTVMLRAGREALRRRNTLLQANKSFAFETTFSGNSERKLIKKAHKQGYTINLVFIGLSTPQLNIFRVAQRVQNGGHNVASEVILRRYDKSFKNIIEIIPLTKRFYYFDNSGTKFKLIASLKEKNLITYMDNFLTYPSCNQVLSSMAKEYTNRL